MWRVWGAAYQSCIVSVSFFFFEGGRGGGRGKAATKIDLVCTKKESEERNQTSLQWSDAVVCNQAGKDDILKS